jgi:hypothetical protein
MPDSSSKHHWLNELRNVHAGKIGFVIGNGWSSTYYDTSKMRRDGVTIGCNLGFTRFDLDYLTWQDMKVGKACSDFKGIKLCIFKHRKKYVHDFENTYFFGLGKYPNKESKGNDIHIMHTGGMAVQLAYVLGCNPIVMVGCDCKIFTSVSGHAETNGHRANVFDVHPKGNPTLRAGRNKRRHIGSENHLRGFAAKFERLYTSLKGVDIYQMGDWSNVNQIPRVDWEEYWSDEHPGKGKHARELNGTNASRGRLCGAGR